MRSAEGLVLIGMIVCLSILIPSCKGQLTITDCFNRADLTHYQKLNDNYEMRYISDDKTITICVRAKTTGYVGFGLSHNGAMSYADMVVGWFDTTQNKPFLKDLHGAGNNSKPLTDKHADWNLLNGKEDATYTTLLFKRKIDTCDTEDFKIRQGTTKVIWSFGANGQDPSDTNFDLSTFYHRKNRGVKSLLLLDAPLATSSRAHLEKTEGPLRDVTFAMTNYKVPVNKTTYACRIMALPQDVVNEKHHMIRWEPIVDQGRVSLIHHMVVFYCLDIEDEGVDVQHLCYNDRPPSLTGCERDIFIVWAVGGTPYNFPLDVGHPVGGPYRKTHFKLEVHYDNVDLKDGMYDNSGIRLVLTKNLRKHDAGLLQTGARISDNHIMPPHFKYLRTRTYCKAGCLKEYMAGITPNITVVGGMLHTHLAGRQVIARHYRNGKELEPIMEDKHFDFNYQEMRSLDTPRVILPDDSLITDCIYNTEDRTDVIVGGFPTEREMCFAYFVYYPEVNVSACTSDVVWEKNVISHTKDFSDTCMYDWTDKATREWYRKAQDDSKVIQFCYGLETLAFNGTIITQTPPDVFQYPTTCPNPTTSGTTG